MKRFRSLDKSLILVVVVVILILLMSDFSSRVGELRKLGIQKETISIRVTQLAATGQVVKAEKAYATSAAAVEVWAREEGRMIQPGDQPIQPIASSKSTPSPAPVVLQTLESVPNWKVWYALFFGK
jgi:hypothetical protein